MTKSKTTETEQEWYFDKPYDPNEEYYFLSYFYRYNIQYVRIPYLTWAQVVKEVNELNQSFGFDPEGKRRFNFWYGLKITPEKELAELNRIWDEEKEEYFDDTLTKREALYGGIYSVDSNWTGWEDLTKQKDEKLEDWKNRVAAFRAKEEVERTKEIKKEHKILDGIKKRRKKLGLN